MPTLVGAAETELASVTSPNAEAMETRTVVLKICRRMLSPLDSCLNGDRSTSPKEAGQRAVFPVGPLFGRRLTRVSRVSARAHRLCDRYRLFQRAPWAADTRDNRDLTVEHSVELVVVDSCDRSTLPFNRGVRGRM